MIKVLLQNSDKYGLIDSQDKKLIIGYKWWLFGDRIYGYQNSTEKRTSLHRLIMHAPQNYDVDHINHDPLDNRKHNLRICTQSQNHWNTKKHRTNVSGFKGVSWNNSNGKYEARIRKYGKKIHIGAFTNPLNAAIAYGMTARYLFGKYAHI